MRSAFALYVPASLCCLALTLGGCGSTGGANRAGAPRVQGLALEMAGAMAFDKGRSAVKPALGRELAALAPRLNAQAGKRLLILGPGDGAAGASQALLAQDRAHSVRDYLVAMGADITRLRSEGRAGSTTLEIRPQDSGTR
jgi:flagellar motor protein MotB